MDIDSSLPPEAGSLFFLDIFKPLEPTTDESLLVSLIKLPLRHAVMYFLLDIIFTRIGFIYFFVAIARKIPLLFFSNRKIELVKEMVVHTIYFGIDYMILKFNYVFYGCIAFYTLLPGSVRNLREDFRYSKPKKPLFNT